MINFKNYYNNLYFMSLLFCNNLLSTNDIINVVDQLTNNGDSNNFLIDILLNIDNNELIYDNFKKYLKLNNLFIIDKEKLIQKTILFIFTEIISNKIDLMDGVKFVIENFVEPGKSKKYFGDYLGLSDIVSMFYTIDDGDIKDSKEVEKATNILFNMIVIYINKFNL